MRADLEARRLAGETEAAERAGMTAEALAAHYSKQQTQIPTPPPPKENGYYLALEEIRAEGRAKEHEEREQRERADGTLRRRREWEQAHAAIEQKRAAYLQAENERHQAAQQQIREHSEDALTKQGERP